MTIFLRLLDDKDKSASMLASCNSVRTGSKDERTYQVSPTSFSKVPGAPFAYWVSDAVRGLFRALSAFEGDERTAKVGLQTGDDFRFVRGWWEVDARSRNWLPFAKGGAFSPFYVDTYLVVDWLDDGAEIRNFANLQTGKLNSRPQNTSFYKRHGLTWGDRTSSFLSVKPWPAGGVFSVKGSAGFMPDEDLYFVMALMNSRAFNLFLEMMVNAGSAVSRSYQVGVIGNVPYPAANEMHGVLSDLALRAWQQKRTLDTTEETSHAFHLPAVLRARLGDYDPLSIEAELADIQTEIDDIAFDLYGFADADRAAAIGSPGAAGEDDDVQDASESEDNDADAVDQTDGLFSWATGVAFGRFDWRLATGEREAPPEPDPFDPLPAKSPGMLPDGAEPFYANSNILLDDQGHKHDLARLIEEVLARVEAPVPADVRRWMQRDFFPFHLKQYSKSRRKAPIYWPISTSSGSYTLWIYYPSLTSQTLYSSVNDFIEGPTGKLQQVEHDLIALRTKGSTRSAADEKSFEKLQALEAELIELRETILEIAPNYRPNQDDGVQISAAPLWRLFRHKPWQKILKATWKKLENGDYDWAHLAMTYWPERVREKCKTDKSLAIAHDLEDLYEEPEVAPGAKRGRNKAGGSA